MAKIYTDFSDENYSLKSWTLERWIFTRINWQSDSGRKWAGKRLLTWLPADEIGSAAAQRLGWGGEILGWQRQGDKWVVRICRFGATALDRTLPSRLKAQHYGLQLRLHIAEERSLTWLGRPALLHQLPALIVKVWKSFWTQTLNTRNPCVLYIQKIEFLFSLNNFKLILKQ